MSLSKLLWHYISAKGVILAQHQSDSAISLTVEPLNMRWETRLRQRLLLGELLELEEKGANV